MSLSGSPWGESLPSSGLFSTCQMANIISQFPSFWFRVPHLLLGYKLPPDSVAYMFILLMSLQYGEGLVRTGGLSSAACWLGGWDHAKAYTMSSEGSHHVWQGMGAFPGTSAGAAAGFLCGCLTSPQGGHCGPRASSSTSFHGPFLMWLALCWA